MGSIVARDVFGIATPRVGLLNIGEEDTKGHELVQEAHELIRASGVNYLGFVEGNDIFDEQRRRGGHRRFHRQRRAQDDGRPRQAHRRAVAHGILARLCQQALRVASPPGPAARRRETRSAPLQRRLHGRTDRSRGKKPRQRGPRRIRPGGGDGRHAMRRGLPAAIASALAMAPSPESSELRQQRAQHVFTHRRHGLLPAGKVVTNFDLEKKMDTTDEWIRTRTGIERRHIAAEGQTTVDLAEVAARRAIEAAGVTPAEIDFIVFGTTTPDLVFPNCGTLLQARLGARGCPAFSVETACSGFIYALSIADKFVKAGEAKCALVVGAETLSRITDWTDRNTAVLFADGAGAVVLKPSAEPGIMSTHLHSDGAYKDLLYVESGVSKGFKIDPATNKVDIGIKMAGSEVFKVAVTKLGGAVDEALAANGLDKSAVNWLIPHQANIRIIGAMAKRLELPMERVIVTVQDHGNTSTASVPLALDVGVRDGRVKRGDLLLLEAFGGGFTWGSALVRY